MILNWFKQNKVRITLIGISVIAIALFFYIVCMQAEHNREISRLKGELSDYNNKIPTVSIIPETKDLSSATISSAGKISSNQADKFMGQVSNKETNISKGKEKPLYTYTFGGTMDNTIKAIRQEIKEEKAPKEVQKADFITVEKDKEETTVKVNAYYNYQPSIYYVPSISPKPFKRHDFVYTNRDLLIDVNYDGDRDGEFKDKIGIGVGKRIASW